MSSFNILFDPHCEVEQNIKTITANVNTFHGQSKCYIIPFGPVYHTTLTVHAGSRKLKEGVDYYVGHRYCRGTHMTARSLVGSIWSIKDGVTGNLTIRGHSLGGVYTVSTERIATYLANDFVAPDEDNWEAVMGGDVFFPPVKIKFDIEAWYGEAALIDAINELAAIKRTQDQTTNPLWQVMNDRFNAIAKVVNDSGWSDHLHVFSNPHNTQHFQFGALQEAAAAVNSLKAYGKDINQLMKYVSDNGISMSDLTPYVKRSEENTITGDIILKDAHAVITGVDGYPRAVIDLSSGNIKIVSAGNVTIEADHDNNDADSTMVLQSGRNILEIRRTPGASVDSLYYNGELVINAANFGENVPVVDVVDFEVHHTPTPTFQFTGLGTLASPLSATITPPLPDAGMPGVVKLTNDWTDNDSHIAATPKLVKDLSTMVDERVDATTKINGIDLYHDINFTAYDFKLGNVSNTSDLAKPINTAAQDAFNGLAVIGHTHSPADIILPQATVDVIGGNSGDDGRYTYTDSTIGILPYTAVEFWKDLVSQRLSISKSLPATVINAKKFFFIDDDGALAIAADGNLNTNSPAKYYNNRSWYDLAEQTINIAAKYPKPWRNRKFYIYVTSINGVGEYYVSAIKKPDNVYQTHLCTYVADASGNGSLENLENTVLRLGKFREMTRHEEDHHAHNFKTPTKTNYHLQNVTNAYPAYTYEEVMANDNRYLSVAAYEDYLAHRQFVIRTGTINSNSVMSAYDGIGAPEWIAFADVSQTANSTYAIQGMSVWMEFKNNKPCFKSQVLDGSLRDTDGAAIHYLIAYNK